MQVAVYNRFLQSMGGGERHSSMLAQVLADEGHEVDLVERAMGKLGASLDHHDRKGRVTEHHHDPEWAYELAHVVKVLAGRLQETTEALREVRRAHDKLVWGLYQSNETYVVARG